IEHASFFVQKLLSLGKHSIWTNYCNEYMKLTGISKADIAKWEVPVAAARLRESISDKERKVLSDIVNARLSRL
ncbi:MAG: hypothetical protein II196_01735, partial [Spirochaetales bacterium]|nr:hypothetical protein [Spirochaetales bacterium]